jgi:hypothetical protein
LGWCLLGSFIFTANFEVRLLEELDACRGQFNTSFFSAKFLEIVLILGWTSFATWSDLKMSCADVICSKVVERRVDQLRLGVFLLEIIAGCGRLRDFSSTVRNSGAVSFNLGLVCGRFFNNRVMRGALLGLLESHLVIGCFIFAFTSEGEVGMLPTPRGTLRSAGCLTVLADVGARSERETCVVFAQDVVMLL